MKKSIQNILQREFYKIGLDQVKHCTDFFFLKALKVQFQGQNSINQIQFSIKSLKYYSLCNEKWHQSILRKMGAIFHYISGTGDYVRHHCT